MAVRGLFFDFDGLLCDTERAARQSWRDLYGRFGLAFPESVWAAMTGRPSGAEIAAGHLGRTLGRAVTEEEVAWRLARKQELSDAEPLRPGVRALAGEAARRGIMLAVVSGSPRSWVAGHLGRLGALEWFDHLVTADGGIAVKPAPDLYLLALRRCGLRAEEVLALEDSEVGVAAARAAGLRCVAVPSAAGRHADLGAASAVLDTLYQISLDGLEVAAA
ncbi:HAD family hydrolase [Nonomuraea endophytica]|nr:HAD-IA family hydrolase [Nonomuraea endophytica]